MNHKKEENYISLWTDKKRQKRTEIKVTYIVLFYVTFKNQNQLLDVTDLIT